MCVRHKTKFICYAFDSFLLFNNNRKSKTLLLELWHILRKLFNRTIPNLKIIKQQNIKISLNIIHDIILIIVHLVPLNPSKTQLSHRHPTHNPSLNCWLGILSSINFNFRHLGIQACNILCLIGSRYVKIEI